MEKSFEIKKLTDRPWLNLYEVKYQAKQSSHCWMMCSRKENPVNDAHISDAVVIIPIIETPQGNRLVVTKEFRVPIWDYEYGFPAGLIDEGEDLTDTVKRELKEETGLDLVEIKHVSRPVYSSAGMSDESCNMAIVKATGTITDKWLEEHENIETILMDAQDIRNLLDSDSKIAAKAWGIFYHFAITGKIE